VSLVADTASLPLFLPTWHACLGAIRGAVDRVVPAGRILAREGEFSTFVHFVETGALTLSTAGSAGPRATIAVIGPGDACGLDALWPEVFGLEAFEQHGAPPQPQLPEVRALVTSRLISVPPAEVRAAVVTAPETVLRILAVAVRQLNRAHDTLAMQLSLRVVDRITRVLQDLAMAHGHRVEGGLVIDLPISQDLIASMVGATRESVNRSLRDLQAMGTVRREGRSYLVRAPGGAVECGSTR
jgi:CRP/FNR family transcriptional regulator, cyclic AMP receptor protein